MINYIRTHRIEPKMFSTAENCFWDDEKYLKPVEYDDWLTFGKYYLSQQLTKPIFFNGLSNILL